MARIKVVLVAMVAMVLVGCTCPEGKTRVDYRNPDGSHAYRCVEGKQ